MKTNPIPLEIALGERLRSMGLTMGTAESCTGGQIAGRMTSVAGSSDYFIGGIVSYSNAVKQHVLGVSEADLNGQGTVSQPVVEQMVQGAMRVLGCDCAVATSGIAGPSGGSAAKPVGTVWIAAAYGNRLHAECYYFGENTRSENIRLSVDTALRMLLDLLPT